MESACPRCGRPGQAISGSTPCHRCKADRFHFDGIIALWAYLDRVRDAIVAAKYAHQAPLGDALGRMLAKRLRPVIAKDRPDTVTFVPSHFTRQFSRGGNGNQTIAAAVATGIKRPCRQLLRTTRPIAKQAWLEEADRAKNVRGAFALKKSYAFPRSHRMSDQRFTNRHILLVDDVLTTGATASEVARVLKEAGASRVTVAVVARAVS